jgi:glycosyltransferase involved in cell wall biosynthesis
MTRIAFIHNRFPAGGAERITIDIASYLSRSGNYEVYVYASRIAEELLTDDIRKVLTVRQIPAMTVRSKRAKEIARLIKQDGVGILVQVAKAVPGIRDIVAKTGVKTVVSCHGEPFWQRYAIVNRRQKGVFRKILWKMFNRKRYSDGSLSMAKAVKRTMKEYNSCDAYTVLCESYKNETIAALGLDPAASHIFAIENPEYSVSDVNYDKEKIVLFCGRFENWSKRIDRLLRIWGKVQDLMPDWRLVLVGNGENWDMLKKMADRMGLKRVHFEGRKTNVADYYRKASVVALTSQTEGWPLALTEAQAQGCVAIAFDCSSGVKEVLAADKGCGIVVPSFDEDRYAEELVRISGMSDDEIMTIRKNAVKKSSLYAPEIIAEKWKALFDRLESDKENKG